MRPNLEKATYFASGSNRPAEIRGLSEIGHPIGVVARSVSKKTLKPGWISANAIAELEQLSGAGLPVFVDSGAFSEVDRGLRVVAPIDNAQWQRVFDIYDRLARALGPDLYIVAPDRVGNQAYTFKLWEKYAPEMKRLRRLGANIIVPLQGGPMALGDVYRVAVKLFGRNFLSGMPMMKGAYEPDDVIDFVATYKPQAVHLLGLGRESPLARPLAAAIRKASPGTELLMDSVLFRRLAGEGKPYTRTRRRIAQTFADELEDIARGPGMPAAFVPLPAYEEAANYPSTWMTKTAMNRFAKAAKLTRAQTRAWRQDPDAWMATGKHQKRYGAKLDAEWFKHVERALKPETTRRTIHELFGYQQLPESVNALCLDGFESRDCGRCRASFSGCCAFHGGMAHTAGQVRREGKCPIPNPPPIIGITPNGATWIPAL